VNRPIRTLSVFCLLLFLALMLNATYLQYVKAKSLDDDPRNRRVVQAAFSRQRGAILAGKTAVAHSVPSKDQFKFQRTYPKPLEYAPITGYFSYYSQTGIEHSQNQVLSGDDSRLFVTRLVDLVNNSDPKGGNVELTVNPKVQDAAYNGIRALGAGVQAAAVAIEPSTGRILAMASTPSFDPNKLADHDLTKSTKVYNSLVKDPAQPMLNRATQTTLPPGSTFKLVTAAAAMEDLGMTPNSLVDGNSSLKLPQTTHVLHNENNESCGGAKVTLTQALDLSCNVSFAQVGLKLSDAQLRAQAEKFGFDKTYLTDLSGQAVSRFPTTLTPPLRALSAIGQYEVAATPLQMAMVSAGIANHGVVMKPYLVDRVTSSDLDVLDQTSPTQLSTAVSPNTASMLTQMMTSVVDRGTGTPARIPGVEVAGKTGTAQSTPNRPPYAWFTGFAPAANPKIAVAVLVQSSNTNRSEIAGGALGGPIAKAMMEAVINP
jgi:peptidoglycan glycosyltransferase